MIIVIRVTNTTTTIHRMWIHRPSRGVARPATRRIVPITPATEKGQNGGVGARVLSQIVQSLGQSLE